MQFPCELVVWKILPAIKAQLAKNLKADTTMRQKDIAKVLDSTEAAISQYLSGRRASEFKIPEEMKEMLKVVSDEIAKGRHPKMLQYGICQVCKEIRTKGMACDACKKESGDTSECSLCTK